MSHLDPDPLRPPDDEPPYVPIAGALRWGCYAGLLAAILSALAVVALIVVVASSLPSQPHPTPTPSPAPAVALEATSEGLPGPTTSMPATTRPGASVGRLVSKTSWASSTLAPVAIRGLATWYRAPSAHDAAAGPGLRRALGPGWRGTEVRVCAADRCLTTRLTDWCACPGGRVVDLDRRAFARLADPSRGVIAVMVEQLGPVPTLPATDTAP